MRLLGEVCLAVADRQGDRRAGQAGQVPSPPDTLGRAEVYRLRAWPTPRDRRPTPTWPTAGRTGSPPSAPTGARRYLDGIAARMDQRGCAAVARHVVSAHRPLTGLANRAHLERYVATGRAGDQVMIGTGTCTG